MPCHVSRYDPPIPGWMLPVVWNTETGVPHKGILAVNFASKPSGLRINWTLRMALAQVRHVFIFPFY